MRNFPFTTKSYFYTFATFSTLLVGKLGINPEIFDQDSPTFHIHKSRIGELISEFKDAQRIMNSKKDETFLDNGYARKDNTIKF